DQRHAPQKSSHSIPLSPQSVGARKSLIRVTARGVVGNSYPAVQVCLHSSRLSIDPLGNVRKEEVVGERRTLRKTGFPRHESAKHHPPPPPAPHPGGSSSSSSSSSSS